MSEQTCNMNESNEGWVKESDYTALKQQRDELRSYARHKIYCPKGIAGAPYPCNCGFEQAIAKAGS